MGLPRASRRRKETLLLTGVLGTLMGGMAVLVRDPAGWYGFVGCVLGAGGLLAALWHRNALQRREVIAFAVAFRLVFLPVLPGLSDDAYRYVWDGMLQAQAGINPYLFRPEAASLSAFWDEPIFEQLNSASYYSVYPPVSQLVFAVGGLFYEGGWVASYLVIKTIFVAMELGGVALLGRMTSARDLMLYAWHPLAVVEVAGQGHTEAAAVLFLVATVWFTRRRSGVAAGLSLTAATWVKLFPVVLFPLLWRRFGLRTAAPAVALTAGLWIPYASADVLYNLASSLNLYVQLFEFNAGPYYAAKEGLRWLTGQDWSKTLGPAFGGLFALTLPIIYWLDGRRQWSFTSSALLIVSLFFLCSTTVHPWYLLMTLPFAVLGLPYGWAWLWLSLASMATYLFYINGPYGSVVAIGWGGAMILAVRPWMRPALDQLMRQRARMKVQRLMPQLETLLEGIATPRVLDLGAGEGFVGEQLAADTPGTVVLADVVDMNKTTLPHVTYDGQSLPWDDNSFDVTILYFVLHHCEDAGQVLAEAQRVSRRGVIIVESTYTHALQHRLLRMLDKTMNRVRSGGAMRAQEAYLVFRRPEEWIGLIEQQGGEVVWVEPFGHRVHPQVLLVCR